VFSPWRIVETNKAPVKTSLPDRQSPSVKQTGTSVDAMAKVCRFLSVFHPGHRPAMCSLVFRRAPPGFPTVVMERSWPSPQYSRSSEDDKSRRLTSARQPRGQSLHR